MKQEEVSNQQDKTEKLKTIAPNPLGQFQSKYHNIEINLPADVSPCFKAIIVLAIVGGATHLGLAWIKSTWISYLSFDILFIFLLLILWGERRQKYDTRRSKEESTVQP